MTESWHQVMDHARKGCVELLTPFTNDANSIILPATTETFQLKLPAGSQEVVKNTWWRRVKDRYRKYFVGVSIFGVLGLPIRLFIGLGVMLRSMFPGFTEEQLKEGQNELRRRLNAYIQVAKSQFFDVDQARGKSSLVEEELNKLERAVVEHIDAIASRKDKEARTELQRMEQQMKLQREQERRAAAQAAKASLADWDLLRTTLSNIEPELQALDRETAAPASVVAV